MEERVQMADGTRLHYRRIPITSERPPDFTDLSDLMEVVSRIHSTNTPVILNDQLGRGRSTVASVSVSSESLVMSSDLWTLRSLYCSFNSGSNWGKTMHETGSLVLHQRSCAGQPAF